MMMQTALFLMTLSQLDTRTTSKVELARVMATTVVISKAIPFYLRNFVTTLLYITTGDL